MTGFVSVNIMYFLHAPVCNLARSVVSSIDTCLNYKQHVLSLVTSSGFADTKSLTLQQAPFDNHARFCVSFTSQFCRAVVCTSIVIFYTSCQRFFSSSPSHCRQPSTRLFINYILVKQLLSVLCTAVVGVVDHQLILWGIKCFDVYELLALLYTLSECFYAYTAGIFVHKPRTFLATIPYRFFVHQLLQLSYINC